MSDEDFLEEMIETQPFPFSERTNEQLKAAVRSILESVGEDPDREGLKGTPARVARMFEEVLQGYHVDPAALVNGALFTVDYDEMVVVKDIEYYSTCEHHIVPFYGVAHVAYLPHEKVIGLSKIPRVVDMFARRLQLQERMTRQIADFLNEVLQPKGVAVVVEGAHLCSMMRGVRKANARMVTSAVLGRFKSDARTRSEFFEHLRKHGE